MSLPISVNCSGALFSSLQFELAKNRRPQEGFLLGHVEKFTSHSISDSEMHNENTNVIINVSAFCSFSSIGTFYSGCGQVNTKFLQAYIGNNLEKVVGWYHCRGSCEETYLREIIVHQQLRDLMTHTDGYFLFAVFSSIHPAESGTLDLSYRFQIMQNNNEFEGIPLEIVNMSDTSSSQYMRVAPTFPLYNSNALQTVIGNLKNLEPGVKEAELLHQGLLNQLRDLLPKYSCIQEEQHKLNQEVSRMRTYCHSLSIKPEFEPCTMKDSDFELMEMESNSPNKIKTQLQNLNSSCSSEKPADDREIEATVKGKTKDPFGFVDKEMERQKTTGSTKVKDLNTKKEPTNNVLNNDINQQNSKKLRTRMVKKSIKTQESQPIKSAAPRAKELKGNTSNSSGSSSSSSSSSSPSRRESPRESNINTRKQNATPSKLKATQILKPNSSPEERFRSPSKIINNDIKPKENEEWTDNKVRCSSPEF